MENTENKVPDNLENALNVLKRGPGPIRGRGRPKKSFWPDTSSSPDYLDIPLSELEMVDVSDENVEKIARGFLVGKKAIGRRNDVRKILEDKVVGRIGKKGKWLVDKLFELIEGVKVVEKVNVVEGKNTAIRYYKTPPSLNAIIYALDRVLGKPKQMNVQANFSLSQLLIGNTQSSNGKLGSGNNEANAEESDIFLPEDLEN